MGILRKIEDRKRDHIDICLTRPVSMRRRNGFEDYDLMAQALPELNLTEISLATRFLGRDLAAPVMIAAMTGGSKQAREINRHLAEAAQELGLAMGVGSQRIMFEDSSARSSFTVVREVAPHILLFGNLGAVQLNYGFTKDMVRNAVDIIEGDGIFLHLNSLQEAIQPEGNTNFRGLLARIGEVAMQLSFPVMVKEVGSGIHPELATELAAHHVAAIDVGGAGGTSWAAIEAFRATSPISKDLGKVFGNWGIPTAQSLRLCHERLPDYPLIATGGIRDGLTIAKALVLGASLVGIAKPLLEPATQSTAAVIATLEKLLAELRVAMFLVGASDIRTLKSMRIFKKGQL